MKAIVVYDSVFGNTELIAKAIGIAVGAVSVVRAADIQAENLKDVDVLYVGSPTRAFRPTPAVKAFLKSLPMGSLNCVKTAAFDTRGKMDEVPSRFLAFMVKRFGYAAEFIAKKLSRPGGKPAAGAAGFFVKGTEGPLYDGELQRAAEWAKKISES